MATDPSTSTPENTASTDSTEKKPLQEPRGFGEHTRGLSGEYAHEQGWGLDVEERTRQPREPQNIDGGNDYEYGAQDLGDEPVNTALDPDSGGPMQNQPSAEAEKEQP